MKEKIVSFFDFKSSREMVSGVLYVLLTDLIEEREVIMN
jgi:hypothetical protein